MKLKKIKKNHRRITKVFNTKERIQIEKYLKKLEYSRGVTNDFFWRRIIRDNKINEEFELYLDETTQKDVNLRSFLIDMLI